MSSSRPKRPNFNYPGLSGLADEPSSKKPRFDVRNPSKLAAAEEELAQEDVNHLDADAIGRRGQRAKRNAVNIEGYESDSDNEGEQERSGQDDDMFAIDEDELAEDLGLEDDFSKKKEKEVKFMEDKDIEGQENRSRGGHALHVDFRAAAETRGDERKGKDKARADADAVDPNSDSSESEVDDETRAAIDGTVDEEIGAGGKKQHAPLLDAFNMHAEQEEGRFDEAGNYVRNAVDPDAVYDSWLDGVSKKDVRKARAAHEKREEERRRQAMEDDKVLSVDLLRDLIRNLQRGETPIEALARLNKGHKAKPKWQNKNKAKRKPDNNGDTEVKDSEAAESPAEVARKKAIDAITTSCDGLLARGNLEIYDAERELLTRQYRRETGDDWVDPDPPKGEATQQTPASSMSQMWEFRWSDARDGGDPHGPYDGATMQQWASAGYFGGGVEFRRMGEVGEWTKSAIFP
ncbi:hypothetical protein KEM56_000004 [Ascosphaera pollenicola]|nr:hypothetical protein KEM56_000004 [Ascosphaera pollenicola]